MTCHEARDLYSALLDEALDAGERSAVESHVAGCAECRRELERFRRTVALLRGAVPVRAPVGFVDRVLAAAVAPAPWYRRLARGLFSPLGVKLPLEAAAVLMVAGIAVYVYQHTPELEQAARQEAPPPPAQPFALPSGPTPPASVSMPPGAARVSPPASEPASAPSSSLNARSASPPASAPPSSDQTGAKTAPASAESPEAAARGSAAAPPASTPADARKSAAPASPPAKLSTPAAPAAPAEPPGSADRARVESDRGAAPRAEGTPDQTAPSGAATRGAGTRADERSRDVGGGTATAESPTTEYRAKEAERRSPEGAQNTVRPERAREPAAPQPRDRLLPSVLTDQPAVERQGALAREEKAGASPAQAAPAPQPMLKSAPAPAPTAGAGDARLQAPPPLPQDAAAKAALSVSAHVAARLAVPEREAAFRALADLLARAGGREVSRHADGNADAVDLVVPREAYAGFLRSLAQIGRLSLEREPATMPDQVRVTLRLLSGGG